MKGKATSRYNDLINTKHTHTHTHARTCSRTHTHTHIHTRHARTRHTKYPPTHAYRRTQTVPTDHITYPPSHLSSVFSTSGLGGYQSNHICIAIQYHPRMADTTEYCFSIGGLFCPSRIGWHPPTVTACRTPLAGTLLCVRRPLPERVVVVFEA